MRIRHLVVVALLACSMPLHAATLRELLKAHGISTSSVPAYALSQSAPTDRFAQSNGSVVVAWSLPGSAAGTWPLHLIRKDRKSGLTTVGEVRLATEDICAGALNGIQLIGEFLLLETHITPSASCALVVDRSLQLRHELYGFGAREVEPGRILLVENMIHFAAVHPERLEIADLASGQTAELYPLENDPLRATLVRGHAAHMPAAEVCARMNDPCSPELFDESIFVLATDQSGYFAMAVKQEAVHRFVEEAPAKTVAVQSVLYIYRHAAAGWAWCESPLDAQEAVRLSSSELSLDEMKGRCEPTVPVVPAKKPLN